MGKMCIWENQESHNPVFGSTQVGKQKKPEDCAFANFLSVMTFSYLRICTEGLAPEQSRSPYS